MLRRNETHTVSQEAQNQFVLNHLPIDGSKVSMVVADGGVELVNGRDFIVQGSNVNYTLQDTNFSVGEEVVFKYFY